MQESHSEQLVILLGVVFLIIIAIFIPIIVSTVRKGKTEKTDLKSINDSTAQSLSSDTIGSNLPIEQISVSSLSPVDATDETTIQQALLKTEEKFWGRIKSLFTGAHSQSEVLDQIEEILYTSDLGPKTVEKFLQRIKEELSNKELNDPEMVRAVLKKEIALILEPLHQSLLNKKLVSEIVERNLSGPTVIMIVGVNGAGKTTSIGKMAAQLAQSNFRVLVAAGDTFRAAAGGQLKVWTERAQGEAGHVEIFWPDRTTDPAAVAYDSVHKAVAQKYDFVLLDTAGRLHTQTNLMEELKKVKRVMGKVIVDAPHETWIVLDGNAGQNAVIQAEQFQKDIEITGVILTKMDGTAKGGAAVAVVQSLQKPIKLIGIGEKVTDLRVFNWIDYVGGILGVAKKESQNKSIELA
jgi:fused signal recognition particle receptor